MKTTSCVKEALLYEQAGKKVRCKTCNRFREIAVGRLGFCKTRMNIDVKLYTLEYSNISSISANPIEKKPFFHFFPGSKALTVGSYGCNFSCPWCQNWGISKAVPTRARCNNYISPDRLVRMVKGRGCQGTSISFNEPTLLLEYSLDVFSLAKKEGYYNNPVYKSLEVGLYNGRTPIELLERTREIGRTEGLNYVYLGNVPGHPYENTYCPHCDELLIKRYGVDVVGYHLTSENKCPMCGANIAVKNKDYLI